MDSRRRLWPVAIPVVFLGYLFVYPVGRILFLGLTMEGGTAPWTTLTSATTVSVVWFTLWQAVASTALTLLIGLPAAWAVSRLGLTRSRWFLAATTVPFVLPTVVVGVAFNRLVDLSGASPLDGSLWAILAAHVFYNVAIVVRLVGVRWAQLGDHLEDAAASLGASPLVAFRRVTLPALAASIRSAGSLVFLLSFTAFGTVLILGGLRLRTIEVEIWRQATQRLDVPAAATLALLQMILVGLALVWQERSDRPRRAVAPPTRPRTHRGVANLVLLALGALVSLPIAALVWSSLQGGGSYGALLTGEVLGISVTGAMVTSLVYAVAATVIAVIVGGAASVVIARRAAGSRVLDRLVLLPLGTSAVTIGLGFLVALDWPVDLRAKPVLVPLAHALVAIPFVTRTMAPSLAAVSVRLKEAAATLGAAPGQVWRTVEWPIVARATLVGAGFAFAISIGEFGATAFVARPADPTLPLLVYRALGRPGTLGIAAAASVVLMVVTGLAVLAVDRFRTGEEAL